MNSGRRAADMRQRRQRGNHLSLRGGEPLEIRSLLTVGITISEFIAANNNSLPDEDGAHSDWVELHNTTASPVNLNGWFLTDNDANLTKWQFPNVTINADAYMVVFASDKDRRVPGSNLHTNFKLSSSGEYLGLVQPDGSTVEFQYAPQFPPQNDDVSYGIGPGVQTTTLVDAPAAGKFLVPTATPLAGDWRLPGFDDSAWLGVTTGIGYQNVPAGASGAPIGYWQFDGNGNDSSGFNHPATLTGAGVTYSASHPSQIGGSNSVSFSGAASQYVTVNPFDVSETATTVSMWFRTSTAARGIFSVSQGAVGGANDCNLFLNGANIAGQLSAQVIASTGKNYTDNAWRHLAYVFQQGTTTQRIFIDGVQVATGTTSAISATLLQDRIFIGYSPPINTTDWFNGQIDDVSVWNVALSPGQIAALATGVSPLELQSYGAEIATSVDATMHNVNSTAYLRIPFNVANVNDYDSLTLRTKYDDGFVAYLNGTEIARRNAPASLAWNSAATASHSNIQAAQNEEIDVSAFLGALQNGTNVLAVQGLNVSANDVDFLLAPTLVDTDQTGVIEQYYSTPTPGGVNSVASTLYTADPLFSLPTSTITANTTVSLSTSTPGATIHYTIDGSIPTEASPAYSSPIAVTTSLRIRARAFKSGSNPSNIVTQFYTKLDANAATFSSNLPIVVVNTYGGVFNDATLIPVTAHFFNKPGERNYLTDVQEFATRAGMRIRGQSSEGFAKQQYAFETWSEADDDQDYSVLGMPAESDWILYAPYTEKALLQNPMAYEMSNEMGQYAVRTLLVEVFIDFNGGDLVQGNFTSANPGDYRGVYVFMEKIKQGSDRVDVDKLGPANNAAPDVTGGYIFSKDKDDPGTNYKFNTSRQSFHHVYPSGTAVTAAQKAYITQYMNDFETALYGANFTDPVNGYAKYIDVDSFIDHHIMVEVTKNIDGYRISTYYNKDRNGKVKMGPVWDYNLSVGNSNYLTGWAPDGWYWSLLGDGDYPYFRRLFEDPNFVQRYTDRWFELREDLFATDRLLAKVDRDVNLLAEAEPRDGTRWAVLGAYVWPNVYFGQGDAPQNSQNHPARTFRDEIEFFKQWLHDRLLWIDAQFLKKPTFSQNGGPIAAGFQLDVSSDVGSIYYTLDGSDPRASGGAIAGSAQLYSGAITLGANAKVIARQKSGNTWGAPREAVFVVDAPDLIVSEIMYHPELPPPGAYVADDFEYVEVQNVGATSINVNGYKFTDGITFTFPNTTLNPGQYGVVVANAAAFAARYPGVTPLGTYVGTLDNAGEDLRLVDNIGVVLFDRDYEDNWEPQTDGEGYSLVTTYTAPGGGPLWNSGDGSNMWRGSMLFHGNPGAGDTGVQPNSIVINEVLSNPVVPGGSWVELYNTTTSAIDISGWYLSDDSTDVTKFQIAAGTSLAPGAYLVLSETSHYGNAGNPGTDEPFSLSSRGESLILSSNGGGGQAGGYRYDEDYGAAAPGVTFARYVTSAGEKDFVAASSPTQGGANSSPAVGPIVINEIMYHPVLGKDEFIELFNNSGSALNLFDAGNPSNTWQFLDGVNFTFPLGVTIPASGFALVVPTSPASFRTKYSIPAAIPIYGPYTGNLDDGGEGVELGRPGVPDVNGVPYIRAERVEYDDDAPWNTMADGDGPSLVRLDSGVYGNEVMNWNAGHAGGTPGVANTLHDTTPPTQVINTGWTLTGVGTINPRTNVSWNAATDAQTGVAYYNVYRRGSSTNATGAKLFFVGSSATTSFTDNTVMQGPTFTYQVAAVNGDGIEGPPSTLTGTVPIANNDTYSVAESGTLVTTTAADSPTVIIPTGSVWKYRDNGTDQGTAWRAFSFVDTAWAQGPAELGYNDGTEPAEATVVSYGGNASSKYITTYFRKKFVVDNPAEFSAGQLRIKRDDGVSVFINGTEVVRDNLTGTLGDNTILYNTLAPAIAGDDGSSFNNFSFNPAVLVEGQNIIAVEIHQQSIASSDISFDLELNLTRRRTGLLANDIDLEGDTLTAVKLTDPQHGTITVFNANGTFTYVPFNNFNGTDSFTYNVHDPGNSSSPAATVTILVVGSNDNDPPSAEDDIYTASEDGLLNVDLTSATSAVVLPQNSKWDYNDQIALGDSYPSDAQGRSWYEPTYDIATGNAYGAWVPKSDAGNLGGIYGNGVIDAGAIVTPILGAAADTVTYLFRNTFSVTNAQQVGQLMLRGLFDDGARVFINGIERLRANLPAGALATDLRTGTGSEAAYGTFVANAAGDLLEGQNSIAVELHQADAASSDIGFDLKVSTVRRIGLLSNDSAFDGDTIAAINLVPGSTAAANGTLNVNQNGTFTYQPNGNFNGQVSFDYTITSSDAQVSAPATVSIDVLPVPDVTVTPLTTADTTPPLAGTVDEPTAQVVVAVNGTRYAAVNNGDGTWTLADDTISALTAGTYNVQATATTGVDLTTGKVGVDSTTNELTIGSAASVAGRHIFYNNSSWDGNTGAADAQDDAAIATDKAALLPGGTATLANYTSFNKGINGLIIDIAGLSGAPTAADFVLKTGNANSTATWTVLTTAPSLSIRPGAGTGGSTRVTLILPDGTVTKKWLQVTVLAGGNTGLPANDVFYFGNAVGEAGNSAVDAQVNAADELGARGNPRNIANPAPITFLYDYNRDKQVNAADQLISRGNPTNLASRLVLITPTVSAGGPAGAGLAEAAVGDGELVDAIDLLARRGRQR